MRQSNIFYRAIKSIQRGTISITSPNGSATATLSPSVNTAKAVVIAGGYTGGHNSVAPFDNPARVELTNSTTVTAYRTTADTGGSTSTVPWQVIEFY